MKIIKNEKLIKRNGTIGNWVSIAAIAVLGAGMYISFNNRTDPKLFTYSAIALVLGFILVQLGMYMGNRYGRSPRPDEKLDAALKGLPNEFVIYHFATPVSHLLVGPAGIWILMPYHQRGQVTFRKNRWQMSGGGFMQAYLRIFGQEGLSRPDLEIDSGIRSLSKYLAKHMDESEIPEINAMLVFTSDDVEIDKGEATVPAMKVKQIKDFIRQKAKERSISSLALEKVKTALE